MQLITINWRFTTLQLWRWSCNITIEFICYIAPGPNNRGLNIAFWVHFVWGVSVANKKRSSTKQQHFRKWKYNAVTGAPVLENKNLIFFCFFDLNRIDLQHNHQLPSASACPARATKRAYRTIPLLVSHAPAWIRRKMKIKLENRQTNACVHAHVCTYMYILIYSLGAWRAIIHVCARWVSVRSCLCLCVTAYLSLARHIRNVGFRRYINLPFLVILTAEKEKRSK